MKLFHISFLSVLLLFTFSCQNTTDPNVEEGTEKVSIDNSELFEYQTGISGDEELATIIKQPEHSETSKIIRDSTTSWEAVYKYRPKSGFQGTDHVELKLGTGSDGANQKSNIRFIKIEITVN